MKRLDVATRARPTLPTAPGAQAHPPIVVDGRHLDPTPVFDTYWRFAAERQSMYVKRLSGQPGPWTSDPILGQHRFTNCFRAADRVSQYLIRHVAYTGSQAPREVVFRILLFKMFNKIETWQLLSDNLGDLSWESFDVGVFDQVLTAAMDGGRRIYSPAYVIPPPKLGAIRKHTNHLMLLRAMMEQDLPERLQSCHSMAEAFEALRAFPSMGDFLAFQFLIDINYSTALKFDEMDFVVAGPGARDGIRKCFGEGSRGIEQQLIQYMCDNQDQEFERLGLEFGGLFGRRLQLIDCQNLFCEVDKYSRVAHPEILGASGRSHIKQKYHGRADPVPAWFPPKWGINSTSVCVDLAS
jgi:hypothetical protein